jgi:hypothetical protein
MSVSSSAKSRLFCIDIPPYIPKNNSQTLLLRDLVVLERAVSQVSHVCELQETGQIRLPMDPFVLHSAEPGTFAILQFDMDLSTSVGGRDDRRTSAAHRAGRLSFYGKRTPGCLSDNNSFRIPRLDQRELMSKRQFNPELSLET